MSVDATRYALDVCKSTPELSHRARAALLALAGYAGRDGTCWPSRAELVAVLGVNRANVSRALTELVKVGAIDRVIGGGQRCNVYRFPLSTAVSPATPHPARQRHTPRAPATPHPARQRHPEEPMKGHEERAVCDSCAEPVFEEGRWRHANCPPPARRTTTA